MDQDNVRTEIAKAVARLMNFAQITCTALSESELSNFHSSIHTYDQ